MQYVRSGNKNDESWTLSGIENSLSASDHHDAAGEQILPCQVCGYSYTHILGACTLTGSDEQEAVDAYEGTQSGGRTPARRSALAITFTCERGHVFRLIVQQHKGENFMFYQALSGRTWVDIVGGIPGEQQVLGVPEETKLTTEMWTQKLKEWSSESKKTIKQNEALMNRQLAVDGNGSKAKE